MGSAAADQDAGIAAENETAAIKKSNDAAVEGNHGRGLLDDGGEDVIEVQGGSDFLGYFEEGIEDVNFALGFEQVGVVQGDGCLR